MAWKRQTKEEHMRMRRRRRRQLIGGILSVLIVVGAVTLVGALGRNVAKLFDNTKEKESYQKLLAPLVMLDPVPFDSLETADQNMLLQTAIWETIYNEDISKYDRDELGTLILPTVDIDKNAALLFGKGYKLQHASFNASGMDFVYNEETKSYLIPVTGTTGSYTPQVEHIRSSVKEKRVTVGYLAPPMGFSMDGATDNTKPVKYYDFIFTRQDDGYYLSAMKESEKKAEGQTTAVSSSAPNQGDIAGEIMQKAEAAASANLAASSTPAA